MSLDTVVPARAEAPVQSSFLRQRWYLLALLPIAVQLFLAVYRLKHCWDDGAITAAFSRTWAQSARIALTPGSPVVEGFSSVCWFLLLSVPYFIVHHPDAGLIWM